MEIFLKLSDIFILLLGMMIFSSLHSENLEGFNSFVKGNNQFAIELYQQLIKENGNLFFSPISISATFSMICAGAEGKTEKEIKEVFHFKIEEKELAIHFSKLIKELKNISGCELSIANALWIQKGYKLKKEFLDITKKFYDAGCNEVNFKTSPEESRKIINNWVEQKTKGKIKDLIEKGYITSLTRFILTNAIYFNGEWYHQFDKELTKDMPFYLMDGSEKQTPMMQFEDFKKFNYFEDKLVQILEMNYEGEEISMIVILPKERYGIKDVEKILTVDILNKWIESMEFTEVEVYFPKFKIEKSYNLSKNLRELGIVSIFGPEAELSGITGGKDLYINEVFHKSFIDVNETGTEAAAATGFGFPESMPPYEKPEPKVFKADHPFIFLICNRYTKTILFLGRVMEP